MKGTNAAALLRRGAVSSHPLHGGLLVMPHFRDLTHEGPNQSQERGKVCPLAEAFHVSLGRLPSDAQYEAVGRLLALGELEAQTLGRVLEMLAGKAVRLDQRLRCIRPEVIANVLDGHLDDSCKGRIQGRSPHDFPPLAPP